MSRKIKFKKKGGGNIITLIVLWLVTSITVTDSKYISVLIWFSYWLQAVLFTHDVDMLENHLQSSTLQHIFFSV